MSRKIFISLLFLAAGVAPPAGAVDIEIEATQAVLWATIVASKLNVREEPSMEAPVVFQLPRGTAVAIVKPLGQPTRIDGQENTWTLIGTETCANADCTMLMGGWAADSWLAYQDRFERLSESRVGEIKGNDGERDFTYRVAADASFEFITAPCVSEDGEVCEEYLEFAGCREEDFREGDECVGRGDLYVYKSLVWARGYGYLYFDRKDSLCSVFSGRDGAPRMCDK